MFFFVFFFSVTTNVYLVGFKVLRSFIKKNWHVSRLKPHLLKAGQYRVLDWIRKSSPVISGLQVCGADSLGNMAG